MGMDRRRPFGPGRFRTPAGITASPVSVPVAERGRLDLTVYDSTGATIQGTGPLTVLTAETSEKLNEVRTFSCRVPAGEVNSVELIVARQVRLRREGDGVIFVGYIETLEYSDQGDQPIINVTGVGLEIELVEANVYYGLNLTGTTSAKVTQLLALVTDSIWTASVEGGIYAVADYRIDGMSVWAALVDLAQKAGGYIRLTTTTREVELAAANAASGLMLTNVEGQVPASLGANVGLIAALRGYREDASGIVNRVVPFGAASGSVPLDLRLSTRTTPYTIASLIPGKPYLVADASATGITGAVTLNLDAVNGRNLGFVAVIASTSTLTNITSLQFNGIEVAAVNWSVKMVTGSNGRLLIVGAVGVPLGATITVRLGELVGGTHQAYFAIYADVDQTTPVSDASAAGAFGTSNAPASAAITSVVTDFVLGALQRDSMSVTSRGDGETLVFGSTNIDVVSMPGGGSVSASWGLNGSAMWAATIFAVHGAPNYYIEDATSITAYRRQAAIYQAKETHQAEDLVASANALYDAAATYLQRAKDPLIHYGETEPLGLGVATWEIGDTIRLMYRGLTTDRFSNVVKWLDVDANAILLEQTQTFGEDGIRRWKLRLASAIKQPPSVVGLMSKVDELARLPAL